MKIATSSGDAHRLARGQPDAEHGLLGDAVEERPSANGSPPESGSRSSRRSATKYTSAPAASPAETGSWPAASIPSSASS